MNSVCVRVRVRVRLPTFIDGGSGHVVEAERRVHVVDVLQEGEEVLHLLEGDALWGRRGTAYSQRRGA